MARTYYSDMRDRETCVYRIYDDADGTLLYVGISMNLIGRLSKHRQRDWWPDRPDVTVTWFKGREAAKDAERVAIAEERPLHNVTRPISVPIREVSP